MLATKSYLLKIVIFANEHTSSFSNIPRVQFYPLNSASFLRNKVESFLTHHLPSSHVPWHRKKYFPTFPPLPPEHLQLPCCCSGTRYFFLPSTTHSSEMSGFCPKIWTVTGVAHAWSGGQGKWVLHAILKPAFVTSIIQTNPKADLSALDKSYVPRKSGPQENFRTCLPSNQKCVQHLPSLPNRRSWALRILPNALLFSSHSSLVHVSLLESTPCQFPRGSSHRASALPADSHRLGNPSRALAFSTAGTYVLCWHRVDTFSLFKQHILVGLTKPCNLSIWAHSVSSSSAIRLLGDKNGGG